ncbi:MAG: hypothetical protein WCG60_00285 [bacterium]
MNINIKNGISTLAVTIIVIIVVVIFFGGVFTYQYFATKTGKNETTKSGMVTFQNGEKYEVTVGKFVPPFSPSYRDANSNFDLSKPTETLNALFSVASVACKDNPTMLNKMFSLITEETKQDMLKTDKESNGKLFSSCKGTIDNETKNIFSYWVEIEKQDKTYMFLVGKTLIGEKEYPGLSFTLVRQDGKWIRTISTLFDKPYNSSDPIGSISFDLVTQPTYEDFVTNFFK